MMTEDLHSHTESIENERSSSENVTIIAETFSDNGLASATMSSIKSQDSTEQLICKSPQHKSGGSGRKTKNKSIDTREATLDRSYDNENGKEICEKSLEMSAESSSSASSKSTPKYILLLGISQLLIGILMVVCGAMVIVHNSSLSRVGAGLWSGCIAIATGIVGVLAGINDCYGLSGGRSGRGSSPFLTAFLALSLASLAAGNMAAVLAGTGIYRDTHANEIPDDHDQIFEDGRRAWAPVLTNIGLLVISILHCVLSLVSIYRTSKRVCSCFRPKEAFNHNQFDTSYKNNQSPYVIAISNERNQHAKNRKHQEENSSHLSPQEKHHRDMLCRNLESKLSAAHDQEMAIGNHPDSLRGQRDRQKKTHVPIPVANFGSANSKDKLVTSWLGRHHAVAQAKALHAKQKQMKYGVRKMKIKQPQPVLLVPAPHPGSNTLGRPMAVRVVPAMGYGPAPLMQGPPPIYYPVGDMVRMRAGRRHSPTSPSRRPRSAGASGTRRDSQLTRSLERIHRRARERDQPEAKRRGKRAARGDRDVTEQDVIRTYTGLDRTIAEQFIVACDETRNSIDKTDSSGFDTASSEDHSHPF